MPVFREKWQVMAVDAELHIRVVTMELLLSKGMPVQKECSGHCNITCTQAAYSEIAYKIRLLRLDRRMFLMASLMVFLYFVVK